MATELEKMQADQEETMSETVYVQRLTRTQDGGGGWSDVLSTVETTKGRIGNKSFSKGEFGGQETPFQVYVITLPWDTELQEGDQLQINGVNYAIQVQLSHTEQAALQVECVRV
jgi:hypothetical protein